MKRKYNFKLQDLPRLTMLVKGFDTDIKNKAPIFEETQLKAFMLGTMESSPTAVRSSVATSGRVFLLFQLREASLTGSPSTWTRSIPR
jgi:hypothetical protein